MAVDARGNFAYIYVTRSNLSSLSGSTAICVVWVQYTIPWVAILVKTNQCTNCTTYLKICSGDILFQILLMQLKVDQNSLIQCRLLCRTLEKIVPQGKWTNENRSESVLLKKWTRTINNQTRNTPQRQKWTLSTRHWHCPHFFSSLWTAPVVWAHVKNAKVSWTSAYVTRKTESANNNSNNNNNQTNVTRIQFAAKTSLYRP